jgi:hypothetical protein
MDGLRELLMELKRLESVRSNLLGMLQVLIGRRIEQGGQVLSTGLTWRSLAELLKRVRWDKEAVRELGLDPVTLPPRDRLRFWYLAIAHAQVDSDKARAAGDQFARTLMSAGYIVVPGPTA